MSEIEDKKNCCFSLLDSFDGFWAEYKHHSGKVSIILSSIGAISSILVGQHILIGSIALTITNTAIFFSGIAYEKLKAENHKLNSDVESQKQILRRLTILPNGNVDEETPTTNKSNDSVEPVNFNKIHKNNLIESYKFGDN